MKYWSGNDNSIADYLSRNPAPEPINYIENEQMYSKFVGVVKYDKDSIWIFTRLKNPIKESFQVVISKSDGEELQSATRQETKEETGFELS